MSGYSVYLSAPVPTLAQVRAHLTQRFPAARITGSRTPLVMHFGTWKIYVVYSRDPVVAREARGIARRYGKDHPAARTKLLASDTRIELQLDPDPDETHYNDGLLTAESLAELPGAVGFDSFDARFF